MNTLTPVVPAGAQKNRLRPLGGEKVHWTFSCFRLSSRRGREFFNSLLGWIIGFRPKECISTQGFGRR